MTSRSARRRQIKIGDRWIGDGHPPFIVAEAGMNHNGSLETALKMVRAAKKAGADAVKFQTFKAEEFVNDPEQHYTYRSQGREVSESMLAMFKRHELSKEQWSRLKQECDEAGIVFFSTPQNPSDLDVLRKIGIPLIKVGSDDFTNHPLLRIYSKTKLPMIVSCGMADAGEIRTSLKAMGALKGYPTVLLLCTSEYPTPPDHAHLSRLKTLRATFPNLLLGYSDHTQGPLASSLAVALGACVLEKHFTLDHDLPGPDHWFSEDPAGLAAWVESIRRAAALLGNPTLKPTAAEEKMKAVARRSLVTLRDIAPGDTFNESNLGLKRPGSGLPPLYLEKVIGRKARRRISKGELLERGDFN